MSALETPLETAERLAVGVLLDHRGEWMRSAEVAEAAGMPTARAAAALTSLSRAGVVHRKAGTVPRWRVPT